MPGGKLGELAENRPAASCLLVQETHVIGVLGTEEWTRIRIGVGKPPTETGREIKAGGTSYLLSPMRNRELAALDEALALADGLAESWPTDRAGSGSIRH